MVGVASAEFAAANGLTPLARIRSWASVGVDPVETGLAPSVAIPKALDRAGVGLGDVARFEINGPLLPVPVAAVRKLGLDGTSSTSMAVGAASATRSRRPARGWS